MIDFKKVGLAACMCYLDHQNGPYRVKDAFGNDDIEGLWTLMGVAAIAAAIPETQADGECAYECPFLTENLKCTCDWMVVVDKEVGGYTMDAYKPGPNCPARKA